MQIFEDTDRQDDLSMETFYVPYLNIDDIETKDYHASSAEDNGEVIDKGDAESHDPNEEMIIQTRSRGKRKEFYPFKDGEAEWTKEDLPTKYDFTSDSV